MGGRPKIGIIGFADGEPAVHEQLKDIVQKQVDLIVAEVRAIDTLDIVVASTLVNSISTAKAMALEMVSQGVDGVIFSYGVFSFPNFSVAAAQFVKLPCLLMANLNPEWPGMVSMRRPAAASTSSVSTIFGRPATSTIRKSATRSSASPGALTSSAGLAAQPMG